MSVVNITNILFDNEVSLFQAPINMQITFEVYKPLSGEIEWKLIYIGSPENEQYDQLLDSFSMGPLQQGTMQFNIMSQGPNIELIPTKEDLFGVSAIILSAKYQNKEFFRVGYYVYNNYLDNELLENQPSQIILEKLYRQILISSPRVTKFIIDWEGQLTQLFVSTQISNQQFMFNQNGDQNHMQEEVSNQKTNQGNDNSTTQNQFEM